MKGLQMRKIKRFLLGLVLTLLLVNPVFALPEARVLNLADSAGTAITNYSLTNTVVVYSQAIYVSDNVGYASLLITENQAGGTGDVDISTEYSVDGTNWYAAYTSDMAGTITIEGNVVTTLQNATRWIVHTVRLAKWMRYKFDPDADSKITAVSIFQRDR